VSEKERRSTSGFVVDQYYTEQSVDPSPPGVYPYTRGFTPGGYRDKLWAREMYAGFGSPEEANERYRFLLENGATGGVSIALDLPTQLGLDSDAPMARGEVGVTGVALSSYADIEHAFNGVDLAQAGHVFTTANCIAPIFYAWILHYCRQHDVDPAAFTLQIQNDPIKEYIARGTQFLPIEASVRLATDLVAYSHRVTPNWLPISVCGSHMKQAGASPAQEAAFTIANAIVYMEECRRKGVNIGEFNPTLELHFCTDMDFFEEIAKYRAVRKVWAEVATSRFGVPVDRVPFRLHAATSGLPLTAQQPLNNIARITLQALAQILGGVDATRTASWDEALAIPTEGAAATSIRINQIIAYESGIPDTVDPLGGSYYVESLTEKIAQFIRDELRKIDEMGGGLRAVKSGYYAQELADNAYREQVLMETGERIIVGVNRWQTPEEVPPVRFKNKDDVAERRMRAVAEYKQNRDESRIAATLADVRDACQGDDNVLDSVLAAVAAGATVGEISDVWRAVFGEFAADRVLV